MNKSNILTWLRLIKLILTKGSIWIKPYDYADNFNQLWRANSEAEKLKIKHEYRKRTSKYFLLYLPIIGPLVSLLSQLKVQKKSLHYTYQLPKQKLAYIRIPKNASISMLAALLQKQHPSLDISKLSSNQINEMAKEFLSPNKALSNEYFTLVRNPYDRLLSCYFDQMIKKYHHFYFNDYLFSILKEDMTFHEFVMSIKDIPDILKDPHFKPQHYFINDVKNVKTFKIETNKEELDEMLDRHTLSLDIHNKNQKNIDIQDYYTLELKRIVADIYKEDFLQFNYSTK